MNFISEAINRLSTPIIESPDIKQEQKVQCTINLQKIIRGKVVQNMVSFMRWSNLPGNIIFKCI